MAWTGGFTPGFCTNQVDWLLLNIHALILSEQQRRCTGGVPVTTAGHVQPASPAALQLLATLRLQNKP